MLFPTKSAAPKTNAKPAPAAPPKKAAARPAPEPEEVDEDGDAEALAMSEAEHKALAKRMFTNKSFVNATPGERDPYDTPGAYLQKIERFYIKESENPNNAGVPQVILKKRVLYASPKNMDGTLKAGDRVAQVFSWSRAGAISACKGFAAKVVDMSPKEIDWEQMLMLSHPTKQPLAGHVVEVENNLDPQKTGKDEKPFCWVRYMRRVPFTELADLLAKGLLEQDVIDALYPNGLFDQCVAREREALGTVEDDIEVDADGDPIVVEE
jgi:hypothetical protein